MALWAVSEGRAQPQASAAEKEVRSVIEQLSRAYGANDVAKYMAFYADDLTQWWPNGQRVDRETYRKSWTETVQKGGGVEAAEVVDVRIHMAPSGDAALVSYLLRVKRKGVPPERVNAEYQMSPVLFRRDGTWKIVHLHFSTRTAPRPTPPPGALR
jgi:ketosteroid isomerase-like protein